MDDRRGSLAAVDAQALTAEATAAIAAAPGVDELEELRVRYLGRKSELQARAARGARPRDRDGAERGPPGGRGGASAAREAELAAVPAEDPTFDPTLPGEPVPRGSLHLITQLRRRIEDVFLGMGYEVYDGREVETVWHNFDALNQPEAHPSRDPRDTFYFDANTLLRTHTSPSQIRAMQAQAAADLPRLARAHLPARPARRDAHACVPPGRGPRRRPGDHARRPAGHDRALHERDLRQARGADADELLPVHRAVGRVRHHLLPLRRPGLPGLQALGLDRDGRRRRRRPERPRGGRIRPGGVARVRVRARDRPDRVPAPRPARPARSSGTTTFA